MILKPINVSEAGTLLDLSMRMGLFGMDGSVPGNDSSSAADSCMHARDLYRSMFESLQCVPVVGLPSYSQEAYDQQVYEEDSGWIDFGDCYEGCDDGLPDAVEADD